MAVSPDIFNIDERQEFERMAIKAKSLAVRTNSSDGLNGQSKTAHAAPEVAEQMNNDTRKKYAKGLFPKISILHWLTIMKIEN